jgi:hypothetical protein
MEITKDSKVTEVFEEHPETQPIFERYGFHALSNSVLRKTFGRVTSIERGCKMHQVELDEFLEALRQSVIPRSSTKSLEQNAGTENGDKAVEISMTDRPFVTQIRAANIATLVKEYPQVVPVFEKYFGEGCFTCPSFGLEDVEFACSMHGTDPDQFALDCLNAIRKGCDCC